MREPILFMSNRRSRWCWPATISERAPPLCQTRTEPQLERAQRRSAPQNNPALSTVRVSGASGQAPAPPAAAGLTGAHQASAQPSHRAGRLGVGVLPGNALALIYLSSLTDLGSICPTSASSQNQPRHAEPVCLQTTPRSQESQGQREGRLHAGPPTLSSHQPALADPEAGPDLSALSR